MLVLVALYTRKCFQNKLCNCFTMLDIIISYNDILRIDTALSEHTLKSMDPETGAVIPPNLCKGRFVHFTADNIDINDSTLDGKIPFMLHPH